MREKESQSKCMINSLKTFVINELPIATRSVAFLLVFGHEKYIKNQNLIFRGLLGFSWALTS